MSPERKGAVIRVEAEELPVAGLLGRVKELHDGGWRLVTSTCVDRGETLEVNYHFDKDYDLLTLRTAVGKGESIPSLTSIYLCAFLVENENFELFGLKAEGMAVDFGGGLMLAQDAPRTPMLKSAPPAAQ